LHIYEDEEEEEEEVEEGTRAGKWSIMRRSFYRST